MACPSSRRRCRRRLMLRRRDLLNRGLVDRRSQRMARRRATPVPEKRQLMLGLGLRVSRRRLRRTDPNQRLAGMEPANLPPRLLVRRMVRATVRTDQRRLTSQLPPTPQKPPLRVAALHTKFPRRTRRRRRARWPKSTAVVGMRQAMGIRAVAAPRRWR